MEREQATESPRKRLKTAGDAPRVDGQDGAIDLSTMPMVDSQSLKEAEFGISSFVSSTIQGFSGILKKRYTDFLVNEILPSGEVLHLRSLEVPLCVKDEIDGSVGAFENRQASSNPSSIPNASRPGSKCPPANTGQPEGSGIEESNKVTFHPSDEDRTLLESYFGLENAQKIFDLYNRSLASPSARPNDGRIHCGSIPDRELRTKIHHAIRRIFSSQLESSTDPNGTMVVSTTSNRNRNQSRKFRGGSGSLRKEGPSWEELGGPYLHFTIYKENKDTMEVISYVARQLKMNGKSFQFAGTKDRRGVTVQRACVFRVHADRLARLNKSLRGATLGDFEYRGHGLELGDLAGNEFIITLRDCTFAGLEWKDPESAISFATKAVGKSLQDLQCRGYLNYYGLQRFGTFTTSTDTIGTKMLQGDFKGAVDAILQFSPQVLAAAHDVAGPLETGLLISTEDKARAEALHIFRSEGQVNAALDKLPRKFTAEANLVRHLGRVKNDYLGALQTIPRNLRLMYVHAYQSLVWNLAASERWRLYGDKVVEGDLVLIDEHKAGVDNEEDGHVDTDGELIVDPQAGDSANDVSDLFTRARALTAEEAGSDKYTIFDVVLPLPGFDVLYPANAMTSFYQQFMGSEKGGHLDPFDMRRKWRDISLSGSYRKLLSRPGPGCSFEVKIYSKDDEQLVQTDLECLNGRKTAGSDPGEACGDKIAVILRFRLGAGQYATMALRELMKTGGVKTYVPGFSGGR
ncbi:hypothetical protein Egran_01880 [Elaphomyces granulatus]|uniref:TRUD domain-containing protein n=1 Tax=Elaphomyces granulatus TaxID=519963 RepID=A0A232M1T6_9EURO|nr:hypothetical protein Egran_01880 [Elaphomyces granulatus]